MLYTRAVRLSLRRWWLVVAALVVSAAMAVALIAVVLYPHLGAWALRNKVLPRIEARLDRTVRVESIEVERGRAELRNITIMGERDREDAPLASIGRIVVDFDYWKSLRGLPRIYQVEVSGVSIHVARDADGHDNVRDLAEALGMRSKTEAAPPASEAGDALALRPDLLIVTNASLRLVDAAADITATVSDVDAMMKRGQNAEMTMRGIAVRTGLGPSADVESVQVTADPAAPIATMEIAVQGASIAASKTISLSGISGTISAHDQPGQLFIDLSGSYGGATERLWKAWGTIDPTANAASVQVAADRFTLDRLSSILGSSALMEYEKTAIDGDMQIEVRDGHWQFAGTLAVEGANVFHPMLAEKPVRDIGALGSIAGSFDSRSRTLRVESAEIRSKGVDYHLDGFLYLPGGIDQNGDQRRSHTHVSAHLVIPAIPCQTMLDGMPAELVPYLVGYELKGTFATDVLLEIDWANLDATKLDGSVGIAGCKVVQEPDTETGLERLKESFIHYVEVEANQWISFVIGPENPDFVPIWDVSPHLLNAFMTTEDSRFYKHEGFIPSEFRTALISNLKAEYFRFGASSITMQTIKNVALYREKTLARKLQELFLTWYIETILEKDRILEIYVNAIEYGPGLYGIGPAARHYFGKHPRDLNPVEAAFFSSILPSPKPRYKQYCNNRLSRATENKIQRVLHLMLTRKLLTEEEYEIAKATPLVFDRVEAADERECLRMVKKAIENARPTNPMKK